MKRSLIALCFLFATPVFGSETRNNPALTYEVAGTDPREVDEYKIAFKIPRNLNLSKLSTALHAAVERALKSEELRFASLLHRNFSIDSEAVMPFVIKDTYFDTQGLDVFRDKSAYRLRYRWKQLDHYLRHRVVPLAGSGFPTRCEIQLKAGYQIDMANGVVKAEETRFAFDNAASPFDLEQNAPVGPWPAKEYREYARKGVFGPYRMRPAQELALRLGSSHGEYDLDAVFDVVSINNRMHISVGGNPWGSGLTPDRVFALTIDKSEVVNPAAQYKSGWENSFRDYALLEIEIEIERNMLEQIQRTIDLERQTLPVESQLMVGEAIELSKTAMTALQTDLDLLRHFVEGHMRDATMSEPLPLDSKYLRIVKAIVPGQVRYSAK